MEILCRITDRTHLDGVTCDVRVEVEPSAPVGSLTQALVQALGSGRAPVPGGDPPELVRASSGEALDRSRPVAEVGLVSGEGLILRRRPVRFHSGTAAATTHTPSTGTPDEDEERAARAPGGGLELVVASGADVGRRQVVPVGRHTIGRDRSCWLVLSDPRLARVHMELVLAPDGGAEAVVGPGTPGVNDDIEVDGRVIAGPTAATVDQTITLGGTTLRLQPVPTPVPWSVSAPGPALGERPFHRTPYFPAPVEERIFEPLGEIPERPEPVRFAYLAALAPLAMGITLALLFSPRFLLFAAFSPILALAGWLDQRRRTTQRFGRGAVRYRARLEQRRADVASARLEERRRRFAAAPDLVQLADRAATRAISLWVRDRGATDFLALRLGLGPVTSAVKVRPETRGDEAMRRELELELEAGAVLPRVPIVVDLVQRPVVALIGADGDTTALATSLLIQAACLHSPEDLVVVAATAAGRDMGRWLKWLPHTRSANSPLAGDHLAHSAPSATRLLRELLVVAEDRAASNDRTIDRRWPRLLAVVDRALEPDPAMVSRLAELGPRVGISVLWLTTGEDRVPRQVVATVTCQPAVSREPSRLALTDPAVVDQPLTLERGPADLAETVARHLAGVRDASSATAASALPRIVPLHQSLGADELTADWVIGRWAAVGGHALPAPIGLGPAGPLVVDLVEHGPHALIGGTSGAGKSELLVSLVAGLVAWNPPSRVNVLFVDYKGGAATDLFRDLPHTVGHVTNLDAALARRALISLRAELTRRMSLLQGRAKDLAEMRERHPDEAPPSLVLVVDEFATLVKEVPDFVTGVVDIAQRGRSLGIHLVLATQRPSGAVNENILANTNLRISLRTLDSAESASIIGTADAAGIATPLKGRGFVRLGPGQLLAFQTAWSGAPLIDAPGPAPVIVAPFDPAGAAVGAPTPVVTARESPVPGDRCPGRAGGRTQLDGLLDAVRVAAHRSGTGPARSPWLDELPAHLSLAAIPGDLGGGGPAGFPVVIGLVDDPAAQAQYPARVDLERGGGLIVVGTGGSGRTTALRTLAVSAALAARDRHDDLSLVVLDFASRQLLALKSLPCCAVATAGDDLEAVTRSLALLDRLLQQRRADLADAALDGAPAPRFAPVLLVIDDYGNLVQTFEGSGAASQLHPWLELLNRIIVDGRQVGIHTALSAGRRSAVKATVLSAVTNRLVLRQADGGGYADLGLPAALADGALPPGRGYLGNGLMVQVASLAPAGAGVPAGGDRASGTGGSPGAAEGAETGAVRHLAATLSAGPHPDLALGPLPAEVPFLPVDPVPWRVALGRGDLDPSPVVVDLSFDDLVVVGEPRSGRSTALAVVARHLALQGITVWAVGPTGSALRTGTGRSGTGCGPGRFTGQAFGRAADVVGLLGHLAEVMEGGDGAGAVLVVDDVDLIDDPVLDGPMARLRAAGLRYVAATTVLRGYSTNVLVQDMKKARAVLHLQPAGAREVQELTGVNPRLRPGLALPPGRGVLVTNRQARVVQVSGVS